MQRCQEKCTPLLKHGNLSAPKQCYHKSLNKVVQSVAIMYFHCGIHLDLKIVEVAHDNETQVKSYITKDLDLLNSYDSWHGETCRLSCTSNGDEYDFFQVLTM